MGGVKIETQTGGVCSTEVPCRLWMVCLAAILFVLHVTQDAIAKETHLQIQIMRSNSNEHQNITIFYNVYTGKPEDIPRVQSIVRRVRKIEYVSSYYGRKPNILVK